ncbi:hypothetical protein J7L06_01550 [Candidatus Bathyarchaeota archaeon]|nr:hypothetical protein [Candidatus Bathyarchaeota archaeon]
MRSKTQIVVKLEYDLPNGRHSQFYLPIIGTFPPVIKSLLTYEGVSILGRPLVGDKVLVKAIRMDVDSFKNLLGLVQAYLAKYYNAKVRRLILFLYPEPTPYYQLKYELSSAF